MRPALASGVVALALIACEPGATQVDLGTWTPTVVARYPHDSNAFTQGLIFAEGFLFESTGRRGQSSLRRVDLTSGRVEQLRQLSPEFFAEGLTIFDDRLIQLTYTRGIGFVYRRTDFSLIEQFNYAGEGWGLTHDGERLIMSDGTSTLRFLDPYSYEPVGTLEVTSDGEALGDLNELEFIDGEIWANIWYDERIARIDPASGEVRGWIDLSALYPAERRSSEAVLNGIAYDADSDRIFVTGKLWPALFEIALDERN